MSLMMFGDTHMKGGAVPAFKSAVSCGYGTSRLHCAGLLRTELKYMNGLWLTS